MGIQAVAVVPIIQFLPIVVAQHVLLEEFRYFEFDCLWNQRFKIGRNLFTLELQLATIHVKRCHFRQLKIRSEHVQPAKLVIGNGSRLEAV